MYEIERNKKERDIEKACKKKKLRFIEIERTISEKETEHKNEITWTKKKKIP